MLKYIALFAALGAVVLAQDSLMDDLLLEQDLQLPCTPKPCVPICKPVTKYVSYGAFKLPYTENVCVDDKACLTANAKCIATLQAAMKAAEAAEKDMIAKAKLANSAKATKASKDAAAAAKKIEEAKAKTALDAGKAAFEVAEKEAATAKAAVARAEASFKAKDAVMNTRLKEFETAKGGHLAAQKAYANAKGEAARAADAYNAAVKAHCDAEAVHAAAVEHIGHGQFKKDECKKYEVKPAYKFLFNGCPRGGKATSWKNKGNYPKTKCEQMCTADPKCNLIEVNGCNSRGSECGINCYHFYGSGSDVRNGKCVTNGDQRAYAK